MLQGMLHNKTSSINFSKIAGVNKFLPHKTATALFLCCSRCLYVNEPEYGFCSNCGFALHSGNVHTIYQLRNKQRKELLKKSISTVQAARVLLYILSALSLAGIGFFFSGLYNKMLLGILSLVTSLLFLLLARWSLRKPFTAMLTAFVIVLTFSTISIFGEFTNTFTSLQGVYTTAFSLLQVYFLLKAVQAAYKADMLKEELEIN